MTRTTVNHIEEARGIPRFVEKPLNLGLKKLAERDWQLRQARGQN